MAMDNEQMINDRELQEELLKLKVEIENLYSTLENYKKYLKDNGLAEDSSLEEYIYDKKEKYDRAMERFVTIGRQLMGSESVTGEEVNKWIIEHAAQQIRILLHYDIDYIADNFMKPEVLDFISERYMCLMDIWVEKYLNGSKENAEFLSKFTQEELDKFLELKNVLAGPRKRGK